MLTKSKKARWVDALRSGKFRQGQGRLWAANKENGGDKYCCLGVLLVTQGYRGGDKRFLLPDWIVATELPTHIIDQLICLNDHDRKSFNEIADWIENNQDI